MEAYGLLYSNSQFLIDQLVAVIGRQVNTVEAEVRGQPYYITTCLLYRTYHVCALGKLVSGWSTR